MAAGKVYRLENLVWDPPILSFEMERHGGTVLGSSRADVQAWTVNLDTLCVSSCIVGHHQLRPMDKRLDTASLASEIAALIENKTTDSRLTWLASTRVRVSIRDTIPETNFKTIQSRRKRFRSQLADLLKQGGWYPVTGTTPNTYEMLPNTRGE